MQYRYDYDDPARGLIFQQHIKHLYIVYTWTFISKIRAEVFRMFEHMLKKQPTSSSTYVKNYFQKNLEKPKCFDSF